MQNCLNNKMSYATKMTFCPVDFVCLSFLTDHIFTPEYKIIYFHWKVNISFWDFLHIHIIIQYDIINFIEAATRRVLIKVFF